MFSSLTAFAKALRHEIRVIQNQTPDILRTPKCVPDTEVGKLLSGLSAKTPDTNVEKLAGLSEAEESWLKTRAADLENDPARVARQLQAQKTKPTSVSGTHLGVLRMSGVWFWITLISSSNLPLIVLQVSAKAAMIRKGRGV
jgi:hypothetical protein